MHITGQWAHFMKQGLLDKIRGQQMGLQPATQGCPESYPRCTYPHPRPHSNDSYFVSPPNTSQTSQCDTFPRWCLPLDEKKICLLCCPQIRKWKVSSSLQRNLHQWRMFILSSSHGTWVSESVVIYCGTRDQ